MAVGTAPVACVVLDWKNSSTVMDMIDNFSIVTSRRKRLADYSISGVCSLILGFMVVAHCLDNSLSRV